MGLEPTTWGLQIPRSSTELRRHPFSVDPYHYAAPLTQKRGADLPPFIPSKFLRVVRWRRFQREGVGHPGIFS